MKNQNRKRTVWSRIFGAKRSGLKKRGQKSPSSPLRFETLEDRALLSVSTAEYAALQSAYPELNLPAQTETNVVEIAAADLSVANLKAALETAGTTPQADVIVLRTTDAENKITFADATDEIAIDVVAQNYGAISIVALGSKPLTLDAAQLSRVLSVAEGSTVELGSVAIIGGKTTENGGGIYNEGTFAAVDVVVSGNVANNRGGGIYNEGTFSATRVVVSGNSLDGAAGAGGGIFNDGTFAATDVEASGNVATSGAGICNYNYATFTATNLTVTGNNALNNGAGIYNLGRGAFTATNLTVSGNTANLSGGGIHNSGGTITATNLIVSGNVARNQGGGIWNSISTFTATNAVISGNVAKIGGGINLFGEDFTVTNATISGNVATKQGGGINTQSDKAVFTAQNSLVVLNSSPNGADVYKQYGSSNAYDVISSYTGWKATENAQIYDATRPLFVVNPEFDESGNLTNADSFDLRLAPGSQAIDAGNDARVPEELATDFSGAERIQGAAVDLGAYEYAPSSKIELTSVSISGTVDFGETLTAVLPVDGATATYQWFRGGKLVQSGSESTYVIQTADAGKTITVKAIGFGGFTGIVKATTARLPKIALTEVTLSGTVDFGETLTAVLPVDGATATYQWFRGGARIVGATEPTYEIQTADAGKAITVKAIGNGGFTGTVKATTARLPKIALTEVAIDGTLQVGETLTATLFPEGATATFQWFRGGALVQDSTDATYTIQTADAGKAITVKALGTGGFTGIVKAKTATLPKTAAAPESAALDTVFADFDEDDDVFWLV